VVHHHHFDLRGWCCMSLEHFASAPIEAAHWLSAIREKLDAFRVP
jgi:hypothetical protein